MRRLSAVPLALVLVLGLQSMGAAEVSGPRALGLAETPSADVTDVATTQIVITPRSTGTGDDSSNRSNGIDVAAIARSLDLSNPRALDAAPPLPDGSVALDLGEEVTPDNLAEVRDELASLGIDAIVEPDHIITATSVPDDPLWEFQWGADERQMPSAWSVSTGQSREPVVAVLDTGVTTTNELTGRVLPGRNIVSGGSDVTDVHGHGTMSATVIAARGNNGVGLAGQCWDCRILPVKILSDNGSGTMSQMAQGIVWAVDNGADLINISAGGPTGGTALENAISYATTRGVAIVASAGNDGTTTPLHPAASPDVIGVAGSSSGGSRYDWSTHGTKVDIAAPGCNVAQSSDAKYYWYCGTSSAAPFASGLLALRLDVDPGLTPGQLRSLARDSSEPVSYVSAGIISGPGVVPGGEPHEPGSGPSDDGELTDIPLTQDPVAPVSVSVANGDRRANLSWSATSGGTGTGYRYDLHRSTGSTCTAKSTRLVNQSTRSYTDTGLVHGRTYRYCVVALDSAGEGSAMSNTVRITARDLTAPAAPSVRVLGVADRAVDLGWSRVTDPTGPVTYRVHRTTSASCSSSSTVVWTGRRTTANIEGLTNGQRSRFCVTATDGAGNRSVASSSTTATPRASRGSCTALTGDWDRSGADGIGWWCDGRVRLRSSNGTITRFDYGRRGDVPIAADWNGDGRNTVSVIRDGTWFLNNTLAGGNAERQFVYGRVANGDVPIAGNWFGGSKDMPGIVRDRVWHLRKTQSGGSSDRSFIYGRLTAGDLPLWGDWNGSGRATVGIVRQGDWHFRNSLSSGPADRSYRYGRVLSGDIPVTGDWTGDRIDTPGIVRDGRWLLKHRHGAGAADAAITFRRP